MKLGWGGLTLVSHSQTNKIHSLFLFVLMTYWLLNPSILLVTWQLDVVKGAGNGVQTGWSCYDAGRAHRGC